MPLCQRDAPALPVCRCIAHGFVGLIHRFVASARRYAGTHDIPFVVMGDNAFFFKAQRSIGATNYPGLLLRAHQPLVSRSRLRAAEAPG
jgi:hypothetical protein